MATTEQQHNKIRRKHSHGEQNAVSIDRLSELPDSVLCHILSFLSTHDSVATTILSRRWSNLWAYVPNLYFNSEDEKIINRVMLLRKVQTVHTFHLDCEIYRSAYQLETWIAFAIIRGVQKIDLCLQDEDVFPSLPKCLFTCKTLVDLRLNSCGVIPLIGAVCLPRLKILRLICVQFEADESLPHLISGCPVLEELEIKLEFDMVYCNVSSPTLKRLVLEFMNEGCGGICDRLEINAPTLEYLRINHCCCEHIKCGVLASLIESEINFNSRHLLAFVGRLCNVKWLTLDFSQCTEIIIDSVISAWTISFRSLTELVLTADCCFLSKFLEIADNLEILTFEFSEPCIYSWAEPPQQVPTCLLSNLRIIKLLDIEGKDYEFEYIRYLLLNAKVLERMEISYTQCLGSNEEINMLKKISLFQ
ncbi:hypothetical protein ABFX02_13G075400 [Erythranthe guttata]